MTNTEMMTLFVGIALAIGPYGLAALGYTMSSGLAAGVTFLAAMFLAVGLFHPLSWGLGRALNSPGRAPMLASMVLAFLVGAAGMWLTVHLVTLDRPRPVRLQDVSGITFENQRVVLDGKEYVDCVFRDVIFVWRGGDYGLIRARIDGKRRLETSSNRIAATIDLLRLLGFLSEEFARDWRRQNVP